jgi:hypothetical protein
MIRSCSPSCCHFPESSQTVHLAPQGDGAAVKTAAQALAPSLGSSTHLSVLQRNPPSPCFQPGKRNQRRKWAFLPLGKCAQLLGLIQRSWELPLLSSPSFLPIFPGPQFSFLAPGAIGTKEKLGQLVHPPLPGSSSEIATKYSTHLINLLASQRKAPAGIALLYVAWV